MTCKWKLIRQFHEGEYELTLGKNAIGRNVNSEVRCSSLFVSRTHCIIEVSEDLIKIIDNKSSNGTYVNYNMIPTDTYHTLYDNDIIGLGVAGDQSLSEEFFVFKLINNIKILQNNIQRSVKRSIGDESIDIDNKRIKIENEASFDDDDNDNMLLNYTQSDNDIVVISDDESSMVQKFEKSFKSSGIVENLDQPNDRLLMEIDEDLSESNNEIICLDSDNEDDDVDKWINKLSQNFSMKGNKSLVKDDDDHLPDLQIEHEDIKGLPLSQNLLKLIEEDAKYDMKNEVTTSAGDQEKKDLVDLEEYDFIANSESNDQNALPEPPTSSTITPSKKTYIKPPIIECPVNMIPRRKSSTGSTLENKSKEKAIQKTVKSEKSKPISKSKRNSVKKLKSIEKGEKKIIGQIRKNRLKELADKTAPPKEFNDSPKIVSKPKVKFTENNRGAFLTDNIPVVPCNKNDSKTKTKNDASLPKVSDLPKIPKKTRNSNDNNAAKKSSEEELEIKNKSKRNSKEKNDSKEKNSSSGKLINNDSTEKRLSAGMSKMKITVDQLMEVDTVTSKVIDNKQLKGISSGGKSIIETSNKTTGILKSCLKSGKKPRRSIKIIMRPEIHYFEIEEGNKLNRCNVKDLPLNWQEKKKSMPAICSQTASINKVENIDNVIALITTWNPTWLYEQKNNPALPPLLKDTPYKRSPLLHSYSSYSDYERTIMPLMIDELWAIVSKEWDNREISPDVRKNAYNIGIDQALPIPGESKNTKSQIMMIHCHMLLSKTDYEKSNHPREGDYIVMGLVQNPGSSTSQSSSEKNTTNIRKRFAFVNIAKKVIARDQDVNESLLKFTKKPYGILYLEFKTKNKPLDLNYKEPMIAYIVSYINPIIRNFKAILALPNSKLCQNVLNPKIEQYTKHKRDTNNGVNMINSLTVLNEAQKKAVMETVADCLLPDPMITLIKGPPGTGKSRVIVSIIQQLLYGENLRTSKRPKILICAPSNAAVDELVCRLLAVRQSVTANKFKMVRFGVLQSMNPRVQDISLQTLSERDVAHQISNMQYNDMDSLDTEKRFLEAKINALKLSIENMIKSNQSTHVTQDKLNKYERKLCLLTKGGNPSIPPYQFAQMRNESQRIILCGADIICTTLSSCVNGQMLSSNTYFNICIVDEATQCTEPETLMPLMLGVSKLILVGDPQQLPATVISQSSKKFGFQKSLFARIESSLEHFQNTPVKTLTLQYRMHPEICHFPNNFFYSGSLKSFKPALDKHNTLLPYLVYSLNFTQTPNFSNSKEADFVISLTTTVLRLTSRLNYSVGIITPYQGQKMCITNKMKQWASCFENRFVDINTIDSIQGQERDVIIISLVRSDGVGFLADFERLNVALTRAKQSLFVCGNFASLKKHEMWSAFIKDAKDRNFFRDAHTICPSNYDKFLNAIAK